MVGPAEGYSSAVAINDAGHILLQVGSDGYLDQAGSLQRLELASKVYNSVRAMNNCDFVAGGYGPDSEHYRAFVWSTTGGFQDLNSLIPSDSGWTLESATAINDRGEIAGRGDYHRATSGHDDDRGFLLIPQWPSGRRLQGTIRSTTKSGACRRTCRRSKAVIEAPFAR